ncbi:Pyruvate dehydrogenase E1 component subunit alpha [Pigmentiphaga humi]|uniref:2-oxoisovalerate dehydrogenase subunit alpha n=1 Tax=Pigmentiphaga humi TaxID=2478468 RepID=A0A3P4B6A2_9BURK|nr:thiamine pyrophosphate-dependent dehydrogenase E1 component subunit alpha [Pigmentiphaga humi]VCU71817.1 Pyruvate dehydrogenase E1 component subunit alpha [Pigmentiphaga humi]
MDNGRASAAGEDAGLMIRLYRLMVRTREFETLCIGLKAAGRIVTNTYPSLGQEAIGAAAAALGPDDVVFPSYRSRPAFFGKGITAREHFRELAGASDSLLSGREVFHHVSWPARGVMPASSMIGAWLPMAAGYALAQRMDGDAGVTACFMGDGTFGAGDFHEAMNLVGLWRLPFVMICENNGYQVSQPWSSMRRHRGMAPYFSNYGFECLDVDGNDALAVYQAAAHARARALAGEPVLLDCFTYRMGSYSTHFAEPREDIGDELASWAAKDPIARLRRHCVALGLAESELDAVAEQEASDIHAAWEAADAHL